jgi:methylase of polypeptide subunit release factors
MVEIGWTQEPAVRALFEARPELTVGPSVKDLGGRFRVVSATRR